MAGIFDSISILVPVLFAISLVGIAVYEKTRPNHTEQPSA